MLNAILNAILMLIFAIAPCKCFSFEKMQPAFHSTIPVVDMNDFNDPLKQDEFVAKVSQALHEVGFFAVVNPGVDVDVLQNGYDAVIQFFRQGLDEKKMIYRADIHGQRGYVPSEKPQGQMKMDFKEFLHIGPNRNIWPEGDDAFRNSLEQLYTALIKHNQALEEAFSLAVGEPRNFFSDMTNGADNLMRAIHYFKNPEGKPWAGAHTDIDLFTILPMATEEGLQVWHDGEWIDVKVPPDAFIVNGGDMLQNISNGYFKSARHRVVSKSGEAERFSIVLFTHAKLQDRVDPLPQLISITGGVQRYPNATEKDLLARRLCELGLAGPELQEFDRHSGLIEQIKALVEAGVAADPVKLTYDVYLKSLK